MAPSSSSSTSTSASSPSSSISPSLPPFGSHLFTPIQEGNESEENESERHPTTASTPRSTASVRASAESIVHHPTPLHPSPNPNDGRPPGKRRSGTPDTDHDRSVSCNNCRPTIRDKTTSVVPVADGKQFPMASPNVILKSIISGLSRKSPRPSTESSTSSAGAAAAASTSEEQWKLAVAELSQKLLQATRKRDEATLEASMVRNSMAELEKKLNRLELYCDNLKSGLDLSATTTTNNSNHHRTPRFFHFPQFKSPEHDTIIDNFLVSVSEARTAVRVLSRALSLQLRQMGAKVFERIAHLLQPYDVKVSLSKNPRGLLFYLEALLNSAFFEDFETARFGKNTTNRILNPIDKCEASYGSFVQLRDLTWEEVLGKGTRHFDEDFSGFCDRKMSDIVAMLGWNRAWPEQLLQAFFGASKSVWLVHLLANSVHPTLSIFRVEKGSRFESVYMEEMGADKAQKLVPSAVRIMVAPGFYVYDNVVKCKVVCRYHNNVKSSCGNGSAHYFGGVATNASDVDNGGSHDH